LRNGVIAPKNTPAIIDFDSNQYLKGIENLGVFYNAIFYKKVVEIHYQPFGNENPYKMYIHPYYLKQYNNRWFVFGFNPAVNKADWNLALDRITRITESSKEYIESPQIDWSEYFEDIIGVTKPTDKIPEEITLIFTGKTCNYVESKPIHGSQKSSWIGHEQLKVTLNIIINYEFERLMLSYSDSLTIISPKKLKDTIKIRLQNALNSI
jgi:predicted DNA-binding transcriptional regulator YafY